jgi:hypothetical protein
MAYIVSDDNGDCQNQILIVRLSDTAKETHTQTQYK